MAGSSGFNFSAWALNDVQAPANRFQDLVIAKLPEGPYDNPNHTFLVGRAFYEIGQAEKAAGLIEQAAQKGRWVPEGSWNVAGTLRIQLTDAPAYAGDRYHVTASAARATCR